MKGEHNNVDNNNGKSWSAMQKKELTWKQGRPLISSSVTKRNLKGIENWFKFIIYQ